MLSAVVGCGLAVATHVLTAWKKFRDHLPVITSRHLSYKTCGHVYNSCVQRVMLHNSESLVICSGSTTGSCLDNLQYQNRGCGNSKSREQLAKLELEDHEHILRDRMLCWIAPVERSIAAARTACIYRLMTGGEAHNDMKEPDGEILL